MLSFALPFSLLFTIFFLFLDFCPFPSSSPRERKRLSLGSHPQWEHQTCLWWGCGCPQPGPLDSLWPCAEKSPSAELAFLIILYCDQCSKENWTSIVFDNFNCHTPSFPGGSDGKESACQCRRGGWERAHGEGHGNRLQYSCLENSMDRGAWRTIVTGSQTVPRKWATNTLPPRDIPGFWLLICFWAFVLWTLASLSALSVRMHFRNLTHPHLLGEKEGKQPSRAALI